MYKLEKSVSYDTNNLINEGEYEVQLERMLEGETPSGKRKLDLMFRFRDVEGQGYVNRVLFDTIWKERETEYYNRRRINMLLGTQHYEDGKTFKNIQEIIDEMLGSYLRIKVVVAYDDYRKEDVNKIQYYMSSQNQPKKLESKKVEVSEDDLPF